MFEATQAGFEDSSFFSTVSINRPRQFKEIVSSVQGNFDFLQESQIDLERKYFKIIYICVNFLLCKFFTAHLSQNCPVNT